MDKNRFTSEPLCKFGPGGQFTSEIQPPQSQLNAPIIHNPMLKVLDVIADLLGGVIQPELLTETMVISKLSCSSNTTENPCEKQNPSNQPDHYPQAISGPASHKHVHEQALLFTDIRRSVRRSEHHASNRIRAYSKSSRKKVNHSIAREGTLFAAYGGSKKTA